MKLDDLLSKSTTSLELLHFKDEEPTGVIFSGYTPDSKEWKQAARKISGPNKKQFLTIEKAGSKIELDKDAADKRVKLLIAITTDISGIDGFKSTPESIEKLLKDPQAAWMLEQWGEHLDDRANFS